MTTRPTWWMRVAVAAVSLVWPSCVTVALTPPVSVSEDMVNFIMVKVPLAVGTWVVPWYDMPSRVAEPATMTDVTVDASTPGVPAAVLDLAWLPEVDPASPAQILYTSGTTGRPKAAVLTHRGLTNNARLAAEAIGLRAGDVMVNPMPYFHVAGCGLITLGLVQTLGTQVVLPRFDPGRALELTERYRGTVIGGVPTMLTALLAAAAGANTVTVVLNQAANFVDVRILEYSGLDPAHHPARLVQ